ncbi:hypothetical protein [Streptomyces sp. NBC_01237]|uniref:hypothetical protein n=1 Tax=Streptomyces sp. NBC_01237 TaxID=2903790 RepID=UPI002DD7CDDD|nr:hypothetical protein [Streptomyces sp. NBC_01237]WRZ78750.1 EI24 domain-containing protein [Streptomyces sp. NBC_01237]
MFGLTTLFAAAGHAHAADIDPVGTGDLMPSPSAPVPKGQGTLYETYSNTSLWMLDSDLGLFDAIDTMLETIPDLCMILVAVIGNACVVCVQWIFQLTSVPELEDAITKSIGGAAQELSVILFPSALAAGALVAFAQSSKGGGGGGGISQVMWVLVSAVVSVSLLSTPQAWVSGVDTVRTVGAGVTMQAAGAGVGDGSGEFPFKMDHQPKFTGVGRDDTLRRSADSVWRTYVATPWCLAEFGSLEVCEKYGKGLLDQGTDKEKRGDWLEDTVTEEAVGSASVAWREGHSPLLRASVMIPALISVIIFAFLIITLAFSSLASLIAALMLLLCGVFFASLWVIPGRPRQWGHAWFDQLLGKALESVIVTLVLGAVLAVQTACSAMMGVYGWLPSTGLTIAAAITALRLRGIIAAIFGVGGGSPAAIGGLMYLGYRAIGRATRQAVRKEGAGPQAPVHIPTPRPGGGGGGPSGGGPLVLGPSTYHGPPTSTPPPTTVTITRPPGPGKGPTAPPPGLPPTPRPSLPTGGGAPGGSAPGPGTAPPPPGGSPGAGGPPGGGGGSPRTGGDPPTFRTVPPPPPAPGTKIIKGEVVKPTGPSQRQKPRVFYPETGSGPSDRPHQDKPRHKSVVPRSSRPSKPRRPSEGA